MVNLHTAVLEANYPRSMQKSMLRLIIGMARGAGAFHCITISISRSDAQ